MRGRSRKGPNPLARVLESNGPDVKIRGTASHIAEKYVNLARDAQASGDPVSAENYLQHAEHYFRMIAAAQAQMTPQQPFFREENSREENYDEDGDDEVYVNGAPVPGLGPQPIVAAPMYQREFRDSPRETTQAQAQSQAQSQGNGKGAGNGNGAGNGAATHAATNGFAHEAAEGQAAPAPEAEAEASAPAAAETGEEAPIRRRRSRRRRVGEGPEQSAAAAPAPSEGDPRATED